MRLPPFEKDGDYLAFEQVLASSFGPADERTSRGECNGWRWGTSIAGRHTAGEGPLYQGRFKSFPVQDDSNFLTVCRYVEANALRAKLVRCLPTFDYDGDEDVDLGDCAAFQATFGSFP